MPCLTKEQILKSSHERKKEKVFTPGFADGDKDAYVWVRMLSGRERDEFEGSIIGRNGDRNFKNVRARFCAKVMVDDEGKQLFAPYEAEALGETAAKDLDRVFQVGQRLNGITDQDIEELAGNSETTHDNGST